MHLVLLSLALLPATALLACSDKAGDSGGSIIDTGTGGTTDNSPCGPWTAFWQVDAEWEWMLDSEYSKENEATGGWSATVLDTEVYGGLLVYRVQEELAFDIEGWDKWEEQYEYRYVCDENGLQILQFEGIYDHVAGLNEESDWWSADFDEPQLMLPVDIAPGDTWGFDTSYTLAYSGSGGVQQPLSVSFNAISQTTVTVGAGTYDVMEVDVVWSADPRKGFTEWRTTAYYAKGVGEVKLDGYAELDWFVGNPEFTIN